MMALISETSNWAVLALGGDSAAFTGLWRSIGGISCSWRIVSQVTAIGFPSPAGMRSSVSVGANGTFWATLFRIASTKTIFP